MGKTLCKKRKKLKRDPDGYALLVREPRFLCAKCGRASAKKKLLCRARPIASTGVERLAG